MNCTSDKAKSRVEADNVIFIEPDMRYVIGRHKSLFPFFCESELSSTSGRKGIRVTKSDLLLYFESTDGSVIARIVESKKAVSLFLGGVSEAAA